MRRLGQVYVFGDFRLDAARRALSSRQTGRAVPLPIPVFDTLLYLVENAGALVERTALLAAVWPHVTVVENSVSQAVSALRRALGDEPDSSRYVLTVPARGYRFIAEVTIGDSVTRDPEAYQYYVAGWSALTRPGGGNLEDALGYLERAVACDPGFGLAHACIADCYTMLCVHGLRLADDVIPKARLAAQRAMEADPGLPEAHVARANLLEITEQDFAAATKMLTHAIALDPLCFSAHRYLGLYLINCGKFDEALISLRRAQAIQPLALYVSGNIGMALYFSGRYDEAMAQFELILRMDPDFEVARVFLGRSLLRLGQLERAIVELQSAPRGTLGRASDLVVALAVGGRPDAARSEFTALQGSIKLQPFDMASIHAALGEDEEALTWLERAAEARSFGFFAVDPTFQKLRGHPRFQALKERLGLRGLTV